MARSKRIMISVPDGLLREVDGIAAVEKENRSQVIRSAVRAYIHEKRRLELHETMRRGYIEMADINLSMAEYGMEFDEGAGGGQG